MNILKVMVTGAGGQLGQELVRLVMPGIEVVGIDRKALDITDPAMCKEVMALVKPNAVIHSAAYTAVDLAETEADKAWQVNVEGTRNAALAAEAVGAEFCYMSTDYVFDGFGTCPYQEEDKAAPRTVYGMTKLAGEQAALEACTRTLIVRTSWIYGRYGSNFVNTMLQLAKDRREVKVVNDQTGSPTYARDLARLLLQMVQADCDGIYHATNAGACTWYDFARAIYEDAGLADQVTVSPCSTPEFPRPAPRPMYSVLGNEALVRAGFQPLRHWREALRDHMEGIGLKK